LSEKKDIAQRRRAEEEILRRQLWDKARFEENEEIISFFEERKP
jgi:hypothetical protein